MGTDLMGRELISAMREWVNWIGSTSDRLSMKKLSGTEETVMEDEASRIFIWKQGFLQQAKGKEGRVDGLSWLAGGKG